MRLAHSGCRVRGLHVTAYNGRLFAPEHAPLAEHASLDEETTRRVVVAVSTRRTPSGRDEPVPFAELGVEQLGSIYERVMDVGDVQCTTAAASPDRGHPRSRERKATGSFYTPRALTDFLVRRTLAPLVAHRSPDELLQLRVLDPAMGSGAFLVAACRYLAAAYERALVAHGSCRSGDLAAGDRAVFRRIVAQRCLYGVDLNPMAVQLGRLSLWLATLAKDRPLTFLDHRLRAGDSLVGASQADLARQPPGRGGRRGRPVALPLLAGLDLEIPLRTTVAARTRLALTADDSAQIVQGQGADAAGSRGRARAAGALAARGGHLVQCLVLASWRGSRAFGLQRPGRVGAGRTGGAQTGASARVRGHRARRSPPLTASSTGRSSSPRCSPTPNGAPRLDAGFDAIVGNPPWDMLRAEDGANVASVRHLFSFVRESGLYTAAATGT